MQLSTASFGVFGACFALCAHSPEGAGERRRACPCMRFTERPLLLMETVSPNACRECHRLDTTLHRRRLPLHSFGECGARAAAGVQFKVSVFVEDTLRVSATAVLPRRDQRSF